MIINAIELLQQDHRALIKAMEEIAIRIHDYAPGFYAPDLDKLFRALLIHYQAHFQVEDEIIYPEFQLIPYITRKVLKAYQAHHIAAVGLSELKLIPYENQFWGAKFLVIRDILISLMNEEELEIFPIALEILSVARLEQLGKKIKQRAQDIMPQPITRAWPINYTSH
jgi:hypothetical protein